MMSQQGYHPRHNHTRFYIFMITLIVGGLFFLLFLNNDGNGFSITNAIIKSLDNNTAEDITSTPENKYFDLSSFTTAETKTEKNSKIFPFFLSFDRAPSMKKRANIGSIELGFLDLTTTIKVNNDKLELNNLQQVSLSINEFSGEIEFKDETLSLSGIAKRIEVNNIAFSSENEIKISFEGLNYQSLKISAIELESLEFEEGNGELKIGEKLSYVLEEDSFRALAFKGNIIIGQEFNSSSFLEAEGNVQGISVDGELLNLNLR